MPCPARRQMKTRILGNRQELEETSSMPQTASLWSLGRHPRERIFEPLLARCGTVAVPFAAGLRRRRILLAEIVSSFATSWTLSPSHCGRSRSFQGQRPIASDSRRQLVCCFGNLSQNAPKCRPGRPSRGHYTGTFGYPLEDG